MHDNFTAFLFFKFIFYHFVPCSEDVGEMDSVSLTASFVDTVDVDGLKNKNKLYCCHYINWL